MNSSYSSLYAKGSLATPEMGPELRSGIETLFLLPAGPMSSAMPAPLLFSVFLNLN